MVGDWTPRARERPPGGRSNERALVEKAPTTGLFHYRGPTVPFFVREGILTMRNDLVRLLEPAVAALHFELVDVEFARAGRGGVLRVFIDRDAR